MLLAAASLVLALGLAELGLRLMPPMGPEFVLAATISDLDHGIFEDDVALRVVLAPNVSKAGFRTNRNGTRGADIPAKQPAEKRILTVGDSFTLGMQVRDDETFSALLDEALGDSVRVLNAGVPGYGTEQAIGMMRRLVPSVQADAVLLTVYTGNDLRDNARWAESPGMPSEPPTVVEAPPPERSGLVKALARHCRIAAYLVMFSDLSRMEDDFRLAEFKDEVLPFAGRDHLKPLLPPTRSALSRFNEACAELQVRCGVALIPPAYVVHTDRLAATFEAFGLEPSLEYVQEPQRAIRGLVRSPTAVVDLTEALQANADEQPYLIFDPHFSAAGHQVAATALQDMAASLVSGP
jgi:lysophospholipase L1-like esterase